MAEQPASGAMPPPLVKAEGLVKSYGGGRTMFGTRRAVHALRGVDLAVRAGEAVGIVGESGCGKSTLGRAVLQIVPPDSGRILVEGNDVTGLKGRAMRQLRRRMQLVFQDPYASLDPRRTIGAQIADGMEIHGLASGPALKQAVARLLEEVGLTPAHAERLPHAFSGGQRQRIAIARALATKPDFIVADEPVSALDVSIQAQVINLLADLRAQHGLALMFISHDLHVVRHLCDRILVMYLGRVVEEGPAAEVFANPVHPYTRMLLNATPSLHQSGAPMQAAADEPPDPGRVTPGCAFMPRCPRATARCGEMVPPLAPIDQAGRRFCACIRAGEA